MWDCVDLIGACPFGEKDPDPPKDVHVALHCMTMIDPATGWFEIMEIPNKHADCTANVLECAWLTRCPWPTEICVDKGREFAGKVSAALKINFGFERKIITTHNPQSNGVIERIHQVVGT